MYAKRSEHPEMANLPLFLASSQKSVTFDNN